MDVDDDEVWALPEFFSWSEKKPTKLKDREFCPPPRKTVGGKAPRFDHDAWNLCKRLGLKKWEIRLDLNSTFTYGQVIAVLEDVGILLQGMSNELQRRLEEDQEEGCVYDGVDGNDDAGEKRLVDACANSVRESNKWFRELQWEAISRTINRSVPKQLHLPPEIVEKIWLMVQDKDKLTLTVNNESSKQMLEEECLTEYHTALAQLYNHCVQANCSFSHSCGRLTILMQGLERAERQLLEVLGMSRQHAMSFSAEIASPSSIIEQASQGNFSVTVRKVIPPPTWTTSETWTEVSFPWTSHEPEVVPIFYQDSETTVAVLWHLGKKRRLASILIPNWAMQPECSSARSNASHDESDNHPDEAQVFITCQRFYLVKCTVHKEVSDLRVISWKAGLSELDSSLQMRHAASHRCIVVDMSEEGESQQPQLKPNDIVISKIGFQDVLMFNYVNDTHLHRKTFDPMTGHDLDTLSVRHKLENPLLVSSKGDHFILRSATKLVLGKIVRSSSEKTILLQHLIKIRHSGEWPAEAEMQFDQSPGSQLAFVKQDDWIDIYSLDGKKAGQIVSSVASCWDDPVLLDGLLFVGKKHEQLVFLDVLDPFRPYLSPANLFNVPAIRDRLFRKDKHSWDGYHRLNFRLSRPGQRLDLHSFLQPVAAHRVDKTDRVTGHRSEGHDLSDFNADEHVARHWAMHWCGDEGSDEFNLVKHDKSGLIAVCPGGLVEVRLCEHPSLEDRARNAAKFREAEEKWKLHWRRQDGLRS